MSELFAQNEYLNIQNWLFNIIVITVGILAGVLLKFFIVKLTIYYKSKNNFSFVRSFVIRSGKPFNIFLPFIF